MTIFSRFHLIFLERLKEIVPNHDTFELCNLKKFVMKTFTFSSSFLFAAILGCFLFFSLNSSGKENPIGGTPGTTITTTSSALSLTAVAPTTLSATVVGTQVTIQWSQSIGQAELMIEDQTGQVVVDDMVNTNNTSSYTIDMTGFDSGTYTVILKSSKQQLTTDFTLN